MNCWFEGHVQGVGFRYQTMSVAKGFEVAGTVQNLTDGRVHLCVEGEESEIQAFQEAVAEEACRRAVTEEGRSKRRGRRGWWPKRRGRRGYVAEAGLPPVYANGYTHGYLMHLHDVGASHAH